MFMFFLLPFLAFAQECTINGTSYAFLTKASEFYTVQTDKHIFTFNICGAVNNETDADAVVGQPSRAIETYSLGKLNTQEEVIDENGIGFKYTGGYQMDNGNKWQSIIYIKCNAEMENDTISVVSAGEENATVVFLMEGKSMCVPVEPEESVVPANSTEPESAEPIESESVLPVASESQSQSVEPIEPVASESVLPVESESTSQSVEPIESESQLNETSIIPEESSQSTQNETSIVPEESSNTQNETSEVIEPSVEPVESESKTQSSETIEPVVPAESSSVKPEASVDSSFAPADQEEEGLESWEIALIIVGVVVAVLILLWVVVLVIKLAKGKRGMAALPISGLCVKEVKYEEIN